MEQNNNNNQVMDMQQHIPMRLRINNSPYYNLVKKLGEGGYGMVYKADRFRRNKNSKTPDEVAIKFEPCKYKDDSSSIPMEWNAYEALGDVDGVPNVYHKGVVGPYYATAMDLLGESLYSYWSNSIRSFLSCNPVMQKEFLVIKALEALKILENVHNKGIVHCDVKPENFVMGRPNTADHTKLFLVDFGLSRKWRNRSNTHKEYDKYPNGFHGTTRYASVNAHLGRNLSRRDDLESLAYSFIYLLRGTLPWERFTGENKRSLVYKCKMETAPLELSGGDMHCPFGLFLHQVINLGYDEDPDYKKLASILKCSLPNYNPRGFPYVQGPKQMLRNGRPQNKWITLYNESASPTPQVHVFDVLEPNVMSILNGALKNNMIVGHAVFSYGQWSFVLDAKISYDRNQVHLFYIPNNPTQDQYIMQMAACNCFISTVCCDSSGRIFMALTQGLPCTKQCFIASSYEFPLAWVTRKWSEGYGITCMTCSPCGGLWFLVMSDNCGFTNQVIEEDLMLPRDSIVQRRKQGYEVTCVSSNCNACVVVLSKGQQQQPFQKIVTSDLCLKEVPKDSDSCQKHMYISSICFGRALC